LRDHEQSCLGAGRGEDVADAAADLRAVDAAESRGADLTVDQILAWADAHHAVHGEWPEGRVGSRSTPVDGVPGESWQAINGALALGLRGMAGDSSLAELLAEHRGAPAPDDRTVGKKILAWEQEQFPIRRPRRQLGKSAVLPPLTIPLILGWADAHHAATGRWPNARSGPVMGPGGDTWRAIDHALHQGRRGLPGGQSVARLLAEHRGVRNLCVIPPLTIEQILTWADAHHAAHGRWPNLESGPVDGAPGETWSGVNIALIKGGRGLPGRTSLARLLIEHRGPQAHNRPSRLTLDHVLEWADAHHAATGQWPTMASGPITGAPGENWSMIGQAIAKGFRGLPKGMTLAGLLAHERGHRNIRSLTPLTHAEVLAWADAYHATHGRWPTARSGPVATAPGETWRGVVQAMQRGGRGMPRGISLANLLAKHRGRRHNRNRPRLTVDQILAWAKAHYAATGQWPHRNSGPVAAAPGETWMGIDVALLAGGRGLARGLSLARLAPTGSDPTRSPEP
jgi:hypothetical protein